MNLKAFTLMFIAVFSVCAMESGLLASTRSGSNYSISAETMDGRGTKVSSVNYTGDGSVSSVGQVTMAVSPNETVKSGYIGQLYQVTGLSLSSNFAANADTQQLDAVQTLDDGTTLALLGTNQSWSVVSGQLPDGLTLNMFTGVISGTPNGSDAYSFTIRVTDGLGNSAQQTFAGSESLATDTPTLPQWGLALLALLLLFTASQSLGKRNARIS